MLDIAHASGIELLLHPPTLVTILSCCCPFYAVRWGERSSPLHTCCVPALHCRHLLGTYSCAHQGTGQVYPLFEKGICSCCNDCRFLVARSSPWGYALPDGYLKLVIYSAFCGLCALWSSIFFFLCLADFGSSHLVITVYGSCSHFSCAKLRQAVGRKISFLYFCTKMAATFHTFLLCHKVGIPPFFLEIICCCSSLAHFREARKN